MSKTLPLKMKDSQYQEIQRIAESRRISVAEWARLALEGALEQQRTASVRSKLESIWIAVQHEFPTGDIEKMLSEIESR